MSNKLQETPRKKALRHQFEKSNLENTMLKRKLSQETDVTSKLETDIETLKQEYDENIL